MVSPIDLTTLQSSAEKTASQFATGQRLAASGGVLDSSTKSPKKNTNNTSSHPATNAPGTTVAVDSGSGSGSGGETRSGGTTGGSGVTLPDVPVDTSVDAGVTIGSDGGDVSAGVDVGDVSADTNLTVGAGSGGVNVGSNTNLAVGGTTTNVGVNAGTGGVHINLGGTNLL
jgi:hypothetical protein